MKRLLTLFFVLGLVACAASVANAVTVIGGSTNNGNLDRTHADRDCSWLSSCRSPSLAKHRHPERSPARTKTRCHLNHGPGPRQRPSPPMAISNPPHPDGCGGPDCAVFFKPFSGGARMAPRPGVFIKTTPPPGIFTIMRGWAGAEANALMADATISIRFLNGANADIGGTTISLLPTLFVPNGQPFNYKHVSLSAVAPAGSVNGTGWRRR